MSTVSDDGSTTTSDAQPLQIDIWTDLVCPWCYVGKSRLNKAIAERSDKADFLVVLHSFELDPRTGAEPLPILDMLSQKYGLSLADAKVMEDRVGGLAVAEGLPYTTDRLHANTFDVHRVSQLAATHGVGVEVFDELQRMYFAGESSPFARESLIAVCGKHGISADEVTEVLDGREFSAEVREDERLASELGITGVPFVVLDRRLGIPGAVSVDQFGAAIDQVLARPDPQ